MISRLASKNEIIQAKRFGHCRWLWDSTDLLIAAAALDPRALEDVPEKSTTARGEKADGGSGDGDALPASRKPEGFSASQTWTDGRETSTLIRPVKALLPGRRNAPEQNRPESLPSGGVALIGELEWETENQNSS
jgi:hypothetical protein